MLKLKGQISLLDGTLAKELLSEQSLCFSQDTRTVYV